MKDGLRLVVSETHLCLASVEAFAVANGALGDQDAMGWAAL
jgi:hypothetical protein